MKITRHSTQAPNSNDSLGFQNPQTDCYLVHDGEDMVQVKRIHII